MQDRTQTAQNHKGKPNKTKCHCHKEAPTDQICDAKKKVLDIVTKEVFFLPQDFFSSEKDFFSLEKDFFQ